MNTEKWYKMVKWGVKCMYVDPFLAGMIIGAITGAVATFSVLVYIGRKHNNNN